LNTTDLDSLWFHFVSSCYVDMFLTWSGDKASTHLSACFTYRSTESGNFWLHSRTLAFENVPKHDQFFYVKIISTFKICRTENPFLFSLHHALIMTSIVTKPHDLL